MSKFESQNFRDINNPNCINENECNNINRIFKMNSSEHSWNILNRSENINAANCFQGQTLSISATLPTNSFYHSSSCCMGSSSELEEELDKQYFEGYFPINESKKTRTIVPAVRVIKKRNTANKKERRRTQSINNAFSCLREKIPNVPSDTKLSKIKTLKLAILYIKYLVEVIDGQQDPKTGFRAELKPLHRRSSNEKREYTGSEYKYHQINQLHKNEHNRLKKGRTGWPQDVWASELVPEQE